ncbi:error-prone DNA polymerase [Rhizobium mongolense]|uniref:Error-prone DNA polymerase n=1 Tax=Rhizobium mongolense TaxID=57676 RepID=A0ABR6ILZ2_9HYPH|nr:error-prone DNA polymerase [Rhizobium mongolense]
MGSGCRIDREGDVVHLVAQRLFDLSGDFSGLADRNIDFKLPSGRGDEFAHGSPGSPDSRERSKPVPQSKDIFVRDLHIDTLKVKSRNFH